MALNPPQTFTDTASSRVVVMNDLVGNVTKKKVSEESDYSEAHENLTNFMDTHGVSNKDSKQESVRESSNKPKAIEMWTNYAMDIRPHSNSSARSINRQLLDLSKINAMANPQLLDLKQHKSNYGVQDQPFNLARNDGIVIVNSADPNHPIISVNNSMSKPKNKNSRNNITNRKNLSNQD
jgi:hypothetical protein